MVRRFVFFLFFTAWCRSFGGVVTAKYAGEFLRTGVVARALGMGGAYIAVAEDVTAIYWNPAGLVSMESLQVHGMHAERFAGIVNWDFVGAGIPVREDLAMGFGFFRLGVDGIPFTRLRDPSREIGEFYVDEYGRRIQNDVYAYKMVDDAEMAFVFSFAKKRSERFSYGGNIKVIRKSAGEYGAWGLGFDVGILMNPYRDLKVGLVLLDGTSTLLAWNGGRRELILPNVKIGAAYPFRRSSFECLTVFDVHVGFEDRGAAAQATWGRMDFDFRGGLEVRFRERIALRLGTDRGRFTTGAGISVSAFNIDYGYMTHADLGNTHRISMTFFWNKNRLSRL